MQPRHRAIYTTTICSQLCSFSAYLFAYSPKKKGLRFLIWHDATENDINIFFGHPTFLLSDLIHLQNDLSNHGINLKIPEHTRTTKAMAMELPINLNAIGFSCGFHRAISFRNEIDKELLMGDRSTLNNRFRSNRMIEEKHLGVRNLLFWYPHFSIYYKWSKQRTSMSTLALLFIYESNLFSTISNGILGERANLKSVLLNLPKYYTAYFLQTEISMKHPTSAILKRKKRLIRSIIIILVSLRIFFFFSFDSIPIAT